MKGKIPSNIKFDISIHKDINDKYENLDDEEKTCYNEIISNFKNGISNEAFTSAGSVKYKQFDALLYNWNIYHLHLQHKNVKGTYSHKENSKILLVTKWKEDKMGLVDIVTHPNGNHWFKKVWLCNADDLFPNMYITFPEATNIINETTDDEEICEISKNSIIFVKIKNKIIVSFQGIATSGNSNAAVGKANYIANLLNKFTNELIIIKIIFSKQ